jgi:hypothetical protein
MGDLTKNFSAWEFECPCGCGQSKMNSNTMIKIQLFRDAYDKSFSPVEGGGYRCRAYEKGIGVHNMGLAIDPGIPRADMFPALKIAIEVGFTGYGLKQKNGRWQMHLDDYEGDAKRPRPWLWTY